MRIGADVGGTFTDVVMLDEQGQLWTQKVPSTPPAYEQAVLRAVEHLLNRHAAPSTPTLTELTHGTTVATNAILERRGAHTGLITTRGFRDVLELRRIRAPQMYNLFFDKPPPLVERYLRFELSERMSADGEELTPLDERELWPIKDLLEREGVESVAVCFLHAYAFPQHEQRVGDFLRRHLPQVQVSLSCEVLRERREYERTATTVVNAYVRPIMQRYLNALRAELHARNIDAPVFIMQSAGGLTPEEDAALRPVFVLESGPAAGVLAANDTARRLNIGNVITLDMGGTTAKASLIENGRIAYSHEYEVGATLSAGNRLVGGGGELIRAPSIDIAEVGAGGGSIAYLDSAGGLRVGPRSAGAVPGPACYGRGGTQPTLTDANVVLGFIRPGRLADGEVSVDPETARRVIHDQIASPMGIDLLAAAEGIHRIANARTMRALRAVSTERGRDPRDFVLLAFGGSGPIHAAGLGRELRVPRALVPPLPGLFSALGLLFSSVEHHDVRSCQLAAETLTPESLQVLRDEMQTAMLAQFAREGFAPEHISLQCSADARFQGQASEIRILLEMQAGASGDDRERLTDGTVKALQMAFMSEHMRSYGHADAETPVEVVALRLIGKAATSGRPPALVEPAALSAAPSASSRRAYFGAQWGLVDTPIITRRSIQGTQCGPLLIDEYDSTIVVPPGTQVRIDDYNNLEMSLE